MRPISGDNTSLTGDGGFGGLAVEDTNLLDSGMRLWEGKYQFKKDMLPRFVGEAFGKKAGFQIQYMTECMAESLYRSSPPERVSISFDIAAMTVIG
jgi:hypothetical protein